MLDMPLPQVAQFVMDTCKTKTESKPKHDVSLVNDIIKFFKTKIIIENHFEHVFESKSNKSSKNSLSKNSLSKSKNLTRSRNNKSYKIETD